MKIIKQLYQVFEMKNYWFNIYCFYHCKKYLIIQLTQESLLLYTQNSSNTFETMSFQIYNTLFLSDKAFTIKKR